MRRLLVRPARCVLRRPASSMQKENRAPAVTLDARVGDEMDLLLVAFAGAQRRDHWRLSDAAIGLACGGRRSGGSRLATFQVHAIQQLMVHAVERQLKPIGYAQLVINLAQIIFYHLLG